MKEGVGKGKLMTPPLNVSLSGGNYGKEGI